MISTIVIHDVNGKAGALSALARKYAPELEILASLSYSPHGISQLEQLQPALVLMDLNIPNTDNFALFETLQYRNFFLVYCTANVGDGRRIPCCGVDYLLKPIDCVEFVTLVESIRQRMQFRNIRPAEFPVPNMNNAAWLCRQN